MAEQREAAEAFVVSQQGRGWRASVTRYDDATRKDGHRPGTRWTKQTLRTVLTNPVYLGRTRLGDEVHDGEHDGIITQATWDRTQALLAQGVNNRSGTSAGRRGTALLSGLLRCGPCDATMGHTHIRTWLFTNTALSARDRESERMA